MAFIDYYKIMGIPKDTPQKDIRAAYTRRAKQFHPDLHPDDSKAEAKSKALNEAYNVLKDPEKRKKYDQFGEHWEQAGSFADAGGAAGAYNGTGGFAGFDFSQFEQAGGGFSSFFEQLFGGSKRRGMRNGTGRFTSSIRQRTEADAKAAVNIDMYTALLGGEIIVQVQDSRLRLRVKPGTQQGTKVRLKGKGYAKGDGTAGDLILTYNVTLPASLNERQRELLEQMRRAGG